jgi:hypothetical protein
MGREATGGRRKGRREGLLKVGYPEELSIGPTRPHVNARGWDRWPLFWVVIVKVKVWAFSCCGREEGKVAGSRHLWHRWTEEEKHTVSKD